MAESTAMSSSKYPFNRDTLASTRLNLQHYLWISSFSYLLHPSIPIPPQNALIADIGCGTGIWSTSLASSPTFPESARIEAFDISLDQTPPPEWTSDKITFGQLDVFDEARVEKLAGRYDIIHIRLFLCVVQDGNPMPLLRNLMKLLKPGGYLQWQEYDPTVDKIIVAGVPADEDPAIKAPKLKALWDVTRTAAAKMQDGSTFDAERFLKKHWVPTLPTHFPSANGSLIKMERVWTAKEALLLKQDTMFLAVREWCASMRVKDAINGEMVRELERLCEEAEGECWGLLGRGSVIDSEMVTWVVRKEGVEGE